MFGALFDPNVESETADHFERKTGHEILKIPLKEDKLGYVYEKGVFVKKVWGGKIVHNPIGENAILRYKKEDVDKIKVFLGDDFSIGPELQNIHHFVLTLENLSTYQLVDPQPLIEYMGQESLPLIEQDFVVSMVKVSKFSVQAFQQVKSGFGVEYYPYPMIKLSASTGSSVQREQEQTSYEIFIGYKLYNGESWIHDFEQKPSVNIMISDPANDAKLTYPLKQVRGCISDYKLLEKEYRTQLRVYVMTRDEFDAHWLLQPETRVGNDGNFEGVAQCGDLFAGNGHRYSIVVFATYFTINPAVNSKIPFLPFDKGKYLINVKREDRIP
jgi:hypothetical protein